jgi:hypothetical protein
MVTKTEKMIDLKHPEVLDEFLKLLKEYGFEFMHDPLNGNVYIKGNISFVNLDPNGTTELSLTDGNKYIKVEINTKNITVRLVRPDPVLEVKVKRLVLRKNVRVYSYTETGYLTIEY